MMALTRGAVLSIVISSMFFQEEMIHFNKK